MTITTTRPCESILQITLNDPDRLNILSQQTLRELDQVITQADQDNSIRGIIITGNGKAFCAGADIAELKTFDETTGLAAAELGQRVFDHIEQLSKPTIAAINGYAFGGGNELAMATTLRIACNKARFSQPEIKLGLIPGFGGTQRLPRLVGKSQALDLCLTGKIISAEEALKIDLIHEVCEPMTLLARATELLEAMINLPPLAIQSVLHTIHQSTNTTQAEGLKVEASHFAKLCGSKDKAEGIDAFLGKRQPDFKGE